MGLYMNLPAIEAQHALTMAKGIAIAFGSETALSSAVYAVTSNEQLAQKVEVQARMARMHAQGGRAHG